MGGRAQLAAPKVANKMARIKAVVKAAKSALLEFIIGRQSQLAAQKVENKVARITAAVEEAESALQEFINNICHHTQLVANEMARIKAAVEAAEKTTILAEAKAAV